MAAAGRTRLLRAASGVLGCARCARLLLGGPRVVPSRTLSVSAGARSRSRLGCQICLTKSMDNMTVRVPEVVADARVSSDLGKNS